MWGIAQPGRHADVDDGSATSSRFSHQGVTRIYPAGFHHVAAKLEIVWCEHDDCGAVLEPTQLIALAGACIARKHGRSSAVRPKNDIEEMQTNTCDQNSRDGDQGQNFSAFEAGSNHGPFVLAKQSFDSFQSDRIYIPGVSSDERDLLDAAIVWCVKTMIHA